MQKQGIIPIYPEASRPFGKALDGGQMVDDDSENVEKKPFSKLCTQSTNREMFCLRGLQRCDHLRTAIHFQAIIPIILLFSVHYFTL